MNNLYRSNDERVIAGVCAGIAHKLDLNVTGLRWVVALAMLFLSFFLSFWRSSISISCTVGNLEGAINKGCRGCRVKFSAPLVRYLFERGKHSGIENRVKCKGNIGLNRRVKTVIG